MPVLHQMRVLVAHVVTVTQALNMLNIVWIAPLTSTPRNTKTENYKQFFVIYFVYAPQYTRRRSISGYRESIDFNNKDTLKILVLNLFDTTEQSVQANHQLNEENQRLKDEINRLKGEKGRPKIPPNSSY